MTIMISVYSAADRAGLITCYEALATYLIAQNPLRKKNPEQGYAEKRICRLLDSVESHEGIIYLAKDGDSVVGYAAGWIQVAEKSSEYVAEKTGWCEDLVVLEDYRGQGIGAKLLAKREAYFRENGCTNEQCDILVANTVSHAMHIKRGFVDYAVTMRKVL